MLKLVPPEMWKMMPEVSFSLAAPALSLVRFGRWKEVLDEKAPPAELPMPTILYHYARARALAALGRLDEAEAEIVATRRRSPRRCRRRRSPASRRATPTRRRRSIWRAAICCAVAARPPTGWRCCEKAVATADGFPYAEPPDWYYPPRQTLAAWLLRGKKLAEAQKVLEEDLKKNPDNGWALTGLREALRAQKKPTAAVDAKLDEGVVGRRRQARLVGLLGRLRGYSLAPAAPPAPHRS